MKKEMLDKVLAECGGKFSTNGWTQKGILAKKALGEKPDKAKVEALKKDSKNFVKTDIVTWPVLNLGERYETIAFLAGLRQAGYSMDLGNITEAAIKQALDGMVTPKELSDEQKVTMAAWRKVIACLKDWKEKGLLEAKSKGLPLAKVAEKLYLHAKIGGQSALPENWQNLVANLEDKIGGKDDTKFEEVELD